MSIKNFFAIVTHNHTIDQVLGLDSIATKMSKFKDALNARLDDIEVEIAQLEDERSRKELQLKLHSKIESAISKIFD